MRRVRKRSAGWFYPCVIRVIRKGLIQAGSELRSSRFLLTSHTLTGYQGGVAQVAAMRF